MVVVPEIEVERVISLTISELKDDDWKKQPVELWYPNPEGGMASMTSESLVDYVIDVLQNVKAKIAKTSFEN